MANHFRQTHHRKAFGTDDRVNSRVSQTGSRASKELGVSMAFGERGDNGSGVQIAGGFPRGNQNSKAHYELVYQQRDVSRRALTNLCYTEITLA